MDADEYPGYFETIGGPDKAMDLGTMQRKIDEGEYNGIEELEVSCLVRNPNSHADRRSADALRGASLQPPWNRSVPRG